MRIHVAKPCDKNPFGHIALEYQLHGLFGHYMPKTGWVVGEQDSIYKHGGFYRTEVAVHDLSSNVTVDELMGKLQSHFAPAYLLLTPVAVDVVRRLKMAAVGTSQEIMTLLKGVESFRRIFAAAIYATELSCEAPTKRETKRGLFPASSSVEFSPCGKVTSVLDIAGFDFQIVSEYGSGVATERPTTRIGTVRADDPIAWDLRDNSCAIQAGNFIIPGFVDYMNIITQSAVKSIILTEEEQNLVKAIVKISQNFT